MDLNIDFNLFRSQKLLLSPHLKQAMDILDMDSQQLSAYAEEQAAANPVLEISYGGALAYEHQALEEENTPTGITLKDYLLLQLEAIPCEMKDRLTGEYLIDNTNENGYLKINTDDAASFLGQPAESIERVLTLLQSFEPPGICARDLKECLEIQLKQLENIDAAAFKVVDSYLDELASGDVSSVADAEGLDEERVAGIFKLIRSLEPRPGREYYANDGIRTLMPDVLVRRIDNVFVPLMNEDAIPVMEIGDYYEGMDIDVLSGDDRAFIQGRVDSAIWLIKCMEQRKSIIFNVSEVIIKDQQDFFINGYTSLKVTTPEFISNELNIHESLVQSAIKGKYLQCRWGTFELRFFCR